MKRIFKLSIIMFIFAQIFIAKPSQAASIKLNKSNITICVGSTAKLKATVKGKSKKVTWRSNKKSVATVSGGTVKGKKAGTAIITAKANGRTAKCKVTVKKSKQNIYTQYRKIIKNLEWKSASIAVYDFDEDGTYEVIAETSILVDGWEEQRKGVILYNYNGSVKQYKYGPDIEYFSGINANGQLISDRTRGKAVIGVYSYSPKKGIQYVTGFFPPYLSEEESEQYEEEYLSDLKNFVFVEASEQNLKTYLGGNGKSTGYTKADLES